MRSFFGSLSLEGSLWLLCDKINDEGKKLIKGASLRTVVLPRRRGWSFYKGLKLIYLINKHILPPPSASNFFTFLVLTCECERISRLCLTFIVCSSSCLSISAYENKFHDKYTKWYEKLFFPFLPLRTIQSDLYTFFLLNTKCWFFFLFLCEFWQLYEFLSDFSHNFPLSPSRSRSFHQFLWMSFICVWCRKIFPLFFSTLLHEISHRHWEALTWKNNFFSPHFVNEICFFIKKMGIFLFFHLKKENSWLFYLQ